MHIIQFIQENVIWVGVVDNGQIRQLATPITLYQLVNFSIETKTKLSLIISQMLSEVTHNYDELFNQQKILLPLIHPDPAHCTVSGTGLTHLNSSIFRSDMKNKNDNELTCAEKIYYDGFKNGKPTSGEPGAYPEWFYKGNGHSLRATGSILEVPSHAKNGGEEAELVAVYIVGPNKAPYYIGFCLGNEFSDHVIEMENQYYLSRSKLLTCSIGPEIYLGDLPEVVDGNITIRKEGEIVWENSFHTGSDRMVHSIDNISTHLFSHEIFRNPGDIHYHFLGADKVSHADKIIIDSDDKIEISANLFNLPLINYVYKSEFSKSPTVKLEKLS